MNNVSLKHKYMLFKNNKKNPKENKSIIIHDVKSPPKTQTCIETIKHKLPIKA